MSSHCYLRGKISKKYIEILKTFSDLSAWSLSNKLSIGVIWSWAWKEDDAMPESLNNIYYLPSDL